jgi:hypothetical protein
MRSSSGFALMLFGWFVLIVAASAPSNVMRTPTRGLGAAVGCGIVLSVMFAPWNEWLPGTAVYLGDPRFSVRYAAAIGLAGLAVTVVSLLTTIWFELRKKNARMTSSNG